MKDERFEIMLLSISYLIRNSLDVYSLGMDKVTVTLDVLVCLLKSHCLLQCEFVLHDSSYRRGLVN
jgi:hypothetical protein